MERTNGGSEQLFWKEVKKGIRVSRKLTTWLVLLVLMSGLAIGLLLPVLQKPCDDVPRGLSVESLIRVESAATVRVGQLDEPLFRDCLERVVLYFEKNGKPIELIFGVSDPPEFDGTTMYVYMADDKSEYVVMGTGKSEVFCRSYTVANMTPVINGGSSVFQPASRAVEYPNEHGLSLYASMRW